MKAPPFVTRWVSFAEDDSGFVAYIVGLDGRLDIHRSQDGRDWTESDIVGDEAGEPTDLVYAHPEQGRLVVGSGSSRYSSLDGVIWEPWNDEDGEGFAIGPGRIQPPGYGPPPEGDQGDQGDPGELQDTMWYLPQDGDPIPIDTSEMSVTHLEVDGGGGGGHLSSNTIVTSQYQVEGAKLRDIWIITFDDVAA